MRAHIGRTMYDDDQSSMSNYEQLASDYISLLIIYALQ